MKGEVEICQVLICVLMCGCPHVSAITQGHIPYYQGNLIALYTITEFYFVDHFGLKCSKFNQENL